MTEAIRQEVVDQGYAKGCADAEIVEENIADGRLSVVCEERYRTGDASLIQAFRSSKFDFVGTDDRRLIRRLGAMSIPYVVPGTLLYQIYESGKMGKETAMRFLEKLSAYISGDEYEISAFLIQGRG